MPNLTYTNTAALLAAASLDWNTAPVYVALLDSTSTYTPNAAHVYLSQAIGANGGVESSGATYARQPLAARSIITDNPTRRALLDAADTIFENFDAGTIKALLLYLRVGPDDSTPADDPLLGYIDEGGFPATPSGATLTVAWDAAGVFTLTCPQL